MNLEVLDASILGPAFLAGLVVLSTHVPLGQQVLARGIIFIDLAVAQIAGLGVIAAHSFHWDPGSWAVQVVAMGAAFAGAGVLYLTERRWPQVQEAIIGTAFVLAATAGILLLSHNPHGGEHLKELLVGQILWVNLSSLVPVVALYIVVLLLWFLTARRSMLMFYLLFAAAVTASVQLVGVYLVFASLIVPALAVRSYPRRLRLVAGYAVGILGYGLGILASGLFDLPAGAAIVWALAACGGIAALVCPRASPGAGSEAA